MLEFRWEILKQFHNLEKNQDTYENLHKKQFCEEFIH